MKLNKVKCFSKIVLGVILFFSLHANIFAVKPSWPLNNDLVETFNCLPEEVQNDLNSISKSIPKNGFNYCIDRLDSCLCSYPQYKIEIIRVTGYAGEDEKKNLIISAESLKKFFGLCKSSLNNHFSQIGYMTVREVYIPSILKIMFEYNPHEIRRWTIKEPKVKLEKVLLSPSQFITLDDFFGL